MRNAKQSTSSPGSRKTKRPRPVVKKREEMALAEGQMNIPAAFSSGNLSRGVDPATTAGGERNNVTCRYSTVDTVNWGRLFAILDGEL